MELASSSLSLSLSCSFFIIIVNLARPIPHNCVRMKQHKTKKAEEKINKDPQRVCAHRVEATLGARPLFFRFDSLIRQAGAGQSVAGWCWWFIVSNFEFIVGEVGWTTKKRERERQWTRRSSILLLFFFFPFEHHWLIRLYLYILPIYVVQP